MSEQDGTQKTIPLPPNADKKAWRLYWEEKGQPWRSEPEIDTKRQNYLIERRSIKPDIDSGMYPFKDIEPKLTRADVEWLLATHENGRGPVDWNDPTQHEREGLDLRGCNSSEINLQNLPLARLQGGLAVRDVREATEEQRHMAAIHLEGASYRYSS